MLYLQNKVIDSCYTYLLAIQVREKHNLQIGHLGVKQFDTGFYYYVGSAKRVLLSRIKRHMRKEKKLFWHIDYLLHSVFTSIEEIWLSNSIDECELASYLEKKSQSLVSGFGSSYCKCNSHLFFCDESPLPRKILEAKGLFYASPSIFY